MITITHILWDGRKIGVALNKLHEGWNRIKITTKNVKGEFLYPGTFVVDKDEIIGKYGVLIINKNGLRGVWIPLKEIDQYKV